MSPEQIEVERKAFEAWADKSPSFAVSPALYGREAWLARAEKAQRVSAQLQFAVDILSRIPALGSSAQIDAMRAALKD